MKTARIAVVLLATMLGAGIANAQDYPHQGRTRAHGRQGRHPRRTQTSSSRTAALPPSAAASPAPAGATIVEANGRPVTPGLFGGLTQIGLEEVNQEESTYDASSNSRRPAWQHMWRPEFDVTPAFNARSILLPVARIEGVTWGVIAPHAADSSSSARARP
jgi:hypothetical protein